jgi:hypothetical protein
VSKHHCEKSKKSAIGTLTERNFNKVVGNRRSDDQHRPAQDRAEERSEDSKGAAGQEGIIPHNKLQSSETGEQTTRMRAAHKNRRSEKRGDEPIERSGVHQSETGAGSSLSGAKRVPGSERARRR